MRTILKILIALALMNYGVESFASESKKNQIPAPNRTVDFSENIVKVHYDFDFSALNVATSGDSIQCEIPGFTTLFSEGNALFPRRTDAFTFPATVAPTISSVNMTFKEITLCAATPDSVIIPSAAFAKDFCVELPLQTSGEQTVARIEINPIVYDPVSKKARLYTSIDYCITLNEIVSESGMAQAGVSNSASQAALDFPFQPTPDPIDYDPVIDRTSFSVREGFLILSVPEFKETLEPFVEWKKMLGFIVTEEYRDDWTPESIRAYILSHRRDSPRIKYMLIVGDHSIVPANEMIRDDDGIKKYYVSDFPYSCTGNEGDMYADIYSGRWPIRNTTELRSIINKSIKYEQTPSEENSLYQSATHFGYFEDDGHLGKDGFTSGPDGIEDRRFARTCEDVRQYMIDNSDVTNIERLYYAAYSDDNNRPKPDAWEYSKYSLYYKEFPDELKLDNCFMWDANQYDVINALSGQRLYFLYRGHGFQNGWGLGCRDKCLFNKEHIDCIDNMFTLPLVFSLTCNTGDHHMENNFSRHLLSCHNGGTYAMYAQSGEGLSGINDMLTSYFFEILWPEPGLTMDPLYDHTYYWQTNPSIKESLPVYRLGQLLDIAVNASAEFYGCNYNDSSVGLYLKRQTHLFGDPSILFRTNLPRRLQHITIDRNSNKGTVKVNLNGDTAYVCLYDPISGNSKIERCGEAGIRVSGAGAERYVNVTIYDKDIYPIIEKGEYFQGSIVPEDSSRLLSINQVYGGKYVVVDYMIAEADKYKEITLLTVDLSTNNIIYDRKITPETYGEPQSHEAYVNSGIMMVSLMIEGYPVSNMKVYIP